MRAVIAIAVLAAGTVAASAQECRFGTNRPAIDTMERHVIPGTPQVKCTQQTITLTTPSGRQRDVQMWQFRMEKETDRQARR